MFHPWKQPLWVLPLFPASCQTFPCWTCGLSSWHVPLPTQCHPPGWLEAAVSSFLASLPAQKYNFHSFSSCSGPQLCQRPLLNSLRFQHLSCLSVTKLGIIACLSLCFGVKDQQTILKLSDSVLFRDNSTDLELWQASEAGNFITPGGLFMPWTVNSKEQ